MRAALEALPIDEEEALVRAPRSAFVDFLLVGGATLFLFPLSWWLRAEVGLDDAELAFGFLFFHAAHVVNDPHFSVTYLLFYEDARERALSPSIPRAQRIRYVVAGLVVPIVLALWAGAAIVLRSPQTLGWMVQLMFVLVGWHYVKQGFGVLSVLSSWRGVRFDGLERRVILAHCYAAWAFAWANPATAAGDFVEKGVVYWAPARPVWLELVSGVALALTAVALLVVLARKHRREGSLPLAPLGGFLVTVWIWTVGSNADPLVRYAIPALHAVQYFFFVALLKGNQAREDEGPPRFGRPVALRLGLLAFTALALGGLLFRGGPALLDDRWAEPGGALGPTPFFAALFVFVNVHHYFMDHVIWRRENPDTRFLRAP